MKGCLQEKGGKYYAVLSIDGKKKWINLQIPAAKGNKRKAEQKMSELVLEYNHNKSMFTRTEFTNFAMEWLCYIKPHIDIVTYQGYEQYVKKHIIPYFKQKNLYIQDMKIADIEGYYNYKSKSGRLDGKKGGLSANTIRLHAVALKLIFKYAILTGLVKENPCFYAVIPKNNIPVKKPKFYTPQQCNRLLEVTEGVILHDIILITFLYGLRRSEIMGLRWCDVDFKNNTVVIQHTRVVNKTVVAKDKTKNESSNRVYPLLGEVRDVLLKLREKQEMYKKQLENLYADSDYIFVNEFGIPFYPSYPTHRLNVFITKYNLPHIRFHDLRHSCASFLLAKGWSMKAISDWLGHSQIGTTMNIYAHIDMDQKRNLAKTIDNTFANMLTDSDEKMQVLEDLS